MSVNINRIPGHAGKESVAYDLSRFDNRSRVQEVVRRQELTVRKQRVRNEDKSSGISLRSAFLFIAVVLTSCMIVYNHMCVAQLSDQTARLRSALAAHKDEEAALRAQGETLYNLSEIEQYVQNNLNMIKFDKSQIEYIQMNNPDVVVKMSKDGKDAFEFFSRIVKSFNAVVEYLN